MEKITIILLTVLVTFPVVLAFHSSGFQSQVAPGIYLSPSDNVFYTNQTHVGDKFNVTVWVQDAADMGAWQVYCEFNDSIVNVTRWFELTSDSEYIFYGKTENALPVPPSPSYVHISSGRGSVMVAASLFPAPPSQVPSNGSGKLCTFEFVITAAPPTSGTLSCPLLINNNSTCLLDPDTQVITGVSKEDGTYSFIYNFLPLPYFTVSPNSIEFRPYQNILSKQFNVGLYVNEVNSGLNLKTVELSLSYNQSLLSTELSNVTLDSLWNGTNNITLVADTINITVTNPASTPDGNVLLGSINFTVLQQSTTPPQTLGSCVSTDLAFMYQALLNNTGGEISQALPIDGHVKIYAYATQPTALAITEPAVISDTDDILSPNTNFSVDINIDTAWQIQSIQLKVQYDPALLNWTKWEPGDALGTYGVSSADNLRGESQARTGTIKINMTLNTIPQTLAGSVTRLTFQCLSIGSCTLNLTDTLVADSAGNAIPVTYSQRDINIVAIPEFPLGYALPILICLTLIAVAMRRKLAHRTRSTAF